ncbi:MAG: hypothetical protein H6Q60_823 [Oscillospiraceae bacterium]|nr:hypothetical protein [Oscillospiraceae bacterium]
MPDCNIYLAPAEFDPQTKKRTKTAVQQINTLIIDLDYKNTDFKGMEAEQLMEYAWSRGFFEKIPCPSFCMESSAGLGLHLIWLLDKPFVVNGDYRNINRWERVLKAICKHFAPLGADNACCDIGHVFRVAGTTNTKTDATAKLLFWEELRNTEPVHYDFEAVEKPFLSS